MRESERRKTFKKRPAAPLAGWLFKVSIFVILLYIGFKFAKHLDVQRQPPAKPTLEVITPAVGSVAVPTPAPQPAPPLIVYPPVQHSQAQQAAINKCVVQGKVSYGDGACPVGAAGSGLIAKSNQNLMAAVTSPVITPAANTDRPSPYAAQDNQAAGYAAKKAECAALDARITSLDSLARQPQSGQMQDWIRGERQKARDRQFGIRCT